jgi:hypothetical protein
LLLLDVAISTRETLDDTRLSGGWVEVCGKVEAGYSEDIEVATLSQ